MLYPRHGFTQRLSFPFSDWNMESKMLASKSWHFLSHFQSDNGNKYSRLPVMEVLPGILPAVPFARGQFEQFNDRYMFAVTADGDGACCSLSLDSLTALCLMYNTATYTVYSRRGQYGRCIAWFIHWPVRLVCGLHAPNASAVCWMLMPAGCTTPSSQSPLGERGSDYMRQQWRGILRNADCGKLSTGNLRKIWCGFFLQNEG